MKMIKTVLQAGFIACLFTLPAQAEWAQVVKVIDVDTFLLSDGTVVRDKAVSEINGFWNDQTKFYYQKRAKEMIEGKTIYVNGKEKDKDGIRSADININGETDYSQDIRKIAHILEPKRYAKTVKEVGLKLDSVQTRSGMSGDLFTFTAPPGWATGGGGSSRSSARSSSSRSSSRNASSRNSSSRSRSNSDARSSNSRDSRYNNSSSRNSSSRNSSSRNSSSRYNNNSSSRYNNNSRSSSSRYNNNSSRGTSSRSSSSRYSSGGSGSRY